MGFTHTQIYVGVGYVFCGLIAGLLLWLLVAVFRGSPVGQPLLLANRLRVQWLAGLLLATLPAWLSGVGETGMQIVRRVNRVELVFVVFFAMLLAQIVLSSGVAVLRQWQDPSAPRVTVRDRWLRKPWLLELLLMTAMLLLPIWAVLWQADDIAMTVAPDQSPLGVAVFWGELAIRLAIVVVTGIALGLIGHWVNGVVRAVVEADEGERAAESLNFFGRGVLRLIHQLRPTDPTPEEEELGDNTLERVAANLVDPLRRAYRHTMGTLLPTRLAVEHVRMLFSAGLFLLVFATVGLFLHPSERVFTSTSEACFVLAPSLCVPVLGYVLLLLILLTLILGTAAIVLDPVPQVSVLGITLLLVFILIMLSNDHFFPTEPLAESETAAPLTIHETLAQWQRYVTEADGDTSRLVLVTASGGGIRAGAWTARVLAGLEGSLGNDFTEPLLLLSTVSGSSMGALFYLDGFERGVDSVRDAEPLDEVASSAAAPSLRSVAHGLLFVEPWRLVPIVSSGMKHRDRGFLLQEMWRTRLVDEGSPRTLSAARERVAEGAWPAPVFNTTVVESGGPLWLSPVRPSDTRFVGDPTINGEQGDDDLACANDTLSESVASWHEIYPDLDLTLPTAARLSATFAYVSPIARPRLDGSAGRMLDGTECGPELHLADGGYYDNFGIDAVVQWLEELYLLPEDERPEPVAPAEVLVLVIRNDARQRLESSKPWEHVVKGPLSTLNEARTRGQDVRGVRELAYVAQALRKEGVSIEVVEFDLGFSVPLSWDLRERDTLIMDYRWWLYERRLEALRRQHDGEPDEAELEGLTRGADGHGAAFDAFLNDIDWNPRHRAWAGYVWDRLVQVTLAYEDLLGSENAPMVAQEAMEERGPCTLPSDSLARVAAVLSEEDRGLCGR